MCHSAVGVFHDDIVVRFMKDILRRYVYGGGTFPQLGTKTWRKLLPDYLVLPFLFISTNTDSDLCWTQRANEGHRGAWQVRVQFFSWINDSTNL